MAGQGWAGHQEPALRLKCALCLKKDRSVDAITLVKGTAVCLEHVGWQILPLTPPPD